MRINGHEIEFTDKHPDHEGTFLWRGELTGDLEVLTVRIVPEQYHGGVKFRPYLGVGHRSINHFQGKFAEIEDL
jgi:hypothetical protein